MGYRHWKWSAVLAGLGNFALAATAGSALASQPARLPPAILEPLNPGIVSAADVFRFPISGGTVQPEYADWNGASQGALFNFDTTKLDHGKTDTSMPSPETLPAIADDETANSVHPDRFAAGREPNGDDRPDTTLPAFPADPAAPSWALVPIGFALVGYAQRKRHIADGRTA